jgi:hypothetical protein
LFLPVLRAKILLIGRDTVTRNKRKLHFVLITEDISERVRAPEIPRGLQALPGIAVLRGVGLGKAFRVKGAKTIGFTKSGLAQSIYAELKEHRTLSRRQSQLSRRARNLLPLPSWYPLWPLRLLAEIWIARAIENSQCEQGLSRLAELLVYEHECNYLLMLPLPRVPRLRVRRARAERRRNHTEEGLWLFT